MCMELADPECGLYRYDEDVPEFERGIHERASEWMVQEIWSRRQYILEDSKINNDPLWA